MTADEKLDEALKGTFPASDAFYIAVEMPTSSANDAVDPELRLGRASVQGPSTRKNGLMED